MYSNRRSYSLVLLLIALLFNIRHATAQEGSLTNDKSVQDPVEATLLSFREFFEASAKELKPSSKLLSLNGKRVKLVGFMSQMEEPLQGEFYLAPRPVFCDEGGSGIGDLPVESVLVIVRSYVGKEVPFVPGALEVTGIIEIGKYKDDRGHPAAFRLVLDRREELQSSKPKQNETNN